ncbi:hypothetical protein TMatcc_005025 [Talaromyces marneffei ATCC 18224]
MLLLAENVLDVDLRGSPACSMGCLGEDSFGLSKVCPTLNTTDAIIPIDPLVIRAVDRSTTKTPKRGMECYLSPKGPMMADRVDICGPLRSSFWGTENSL